MQYVLTELPYALDPLPRLERIRGFGHPVLLDSAASGLPFGRYSVLCAGPVERIEPQTGESGRQLLARLRRTLAVWGPASWPAHCELPFGAGAVGFIAYDFARALETLPSKAQADVPTPALGLGVYLWSLVADHLSQRSWLVCHPALEQSVRDAVLERLQRADSDRGAFRLTRAFVAEQSRDSYGEAFERIQRYIQAGDCYQINLAQRFHARCEGDSLAAYDRLRRACPTPFAAFIEQPGLSVMCLSPERFLELRGGVVETRPIKGTRPRRSDAEQDAQMAAELRESSKDRAENVMIVDLLRNDLGRTCEPGTVEVPELFSVESYPNVHHLVSSIRGKLAPGNDAFDLLGGAFPGGSITGAPKIRAMQIIEELEPVRRSLYCGSIGYVGCEGQMDMNIAIRTLVRHDNDLYLWGGGGIVADSDAEAEYQETLTKVRVLMDGLA